LANRVRLQILQELSRREPQSVSQLAEILKLTLPVASQALRALESRSLLASRRIGRRVEYRLGPLADSEQQPSLVAVICRTFRDDPDALETVFRLATAFTHPRRIEIYRLLQGAPLDWATLQARTRISHRALLRHVAKLEARGFLVCDADGCRSADTKQPLGRLLGRLACA
jgi:DNA-binding transcriptional ArsR family regulator